MEKRGPSNVTCQRSDRGKTSIYWDLLHVGQCAGTIKKIVHSLKAENGGQSQSRGGTKSVKKAILQVNQEMTKRQHVWKYNDRNKYNGYGLVLCQGSWIVARERGKVNW